MSALRQGENGILEGVIWKQLLLFFFPLWLGTFFQQLYNTVDSVVVGRFVGTAAFAAVGATGPVVNLTVGLFTGLASGAVVIIAQHYGARQSEEVFKGVHTAMLLSVGIGAVFTVLGVLLTPWVLRAMGTPEEAMADAATYLRIYFLGMIPNVVYNMGTGVLRAIGDSRRPLYFLAAASLCNIALDLILVLGFHMGVAGVAIATILSQLLSAVLVILSLSKAEGESYRLFPREIKLYSGQTSGMLRLGAPAAFQSLMYSSSNIVIQAAINSFGTATVAAWTAYGKMDLLFWMTLNAMSLALTTFAGQNYGAGKYGRLRRSVRVSVGMMGAFTAGISVILVLFARPMLAIFCPDPEVLEIGVGMVRFLTPFYIVYIFVDLLPGAIRGAGKILVPMLISVFGICGIRLVWLFTVVPLYHTVNMVAASYIITWTVTAIAMLIYYRWGNWLPKGEGITAGEDR